MTFARDLYRDLIDKRLWPVAAALLVALVAIPIVLSKSPASLPTAAPAAAVPAPTIPPGMVSVALPKFRAALQAGGLKDPFLQQHLPVGSPTAAALVGTLTSAPPSDTGATGASGDAGVGGGSSSGGSGAGFSAGSSPSSDPSAGGTPSGGSGHSTAPSQPSTHGKIEVSFGRATGAQTRYTMLAATALPSNVGPILIYLGLQKDGKTAAFLLSSDATAQGDARCTPSRSVCSTILMKPGDSEFLDVAQGNGTIQYELDYVRVLKK